MTAGMLPTLCVPAALIRICGVAPTGMRVLQNRRAVRRVFSMAQPREVVRTWRECNRPLRRVPRGRPLTQEVRVLPPFKFQGDAPSSLLSKEMHRSTKVQCLGAAGFFIALYALNVRRRRADRAEQRGRARKAPRESEAPRPHTQRTRTHTQACACSSQCTHSRRGGHAQQILACSHFADRGPPGGRRRL